MGGKGDDSANQAKQARSDEQARQERIRQGTSRIASIFEGGTTAGSGQIGAGTSYNPNATYYDASGAVFRPTAVAGTPGTAGRTVGVASPNGTGAARTIGGTAGTAGKTAEQAFIEAVNAGKVYSGASKSAGTFTPEYYDKLKQGYIDYATPQLVDQYTDAQKQLVYSLDRSRLLNSSTRGEKEAEAQKIYDTSKQGIVDKGQEYANTAKSNVEDARQGLISTLNATGDAEGAATSAINRATALSAPPAYSPLSQLFADFTSHLGTQAALERAEAASGYDVGKYKTGLFSPSAKKSVAVT